MGLSISIDDAVARIVNVFNIPKEFNGILDYLDKLLTDLESEEENETELLSEPKINRNNLLVQPVRENDFNKPNHSQIMLKIKLDTAKLRYQYAAMLIQDIHWEIGNNLDASILKLAPNDSGSLKLDLLSFTDWAKQTHGIDRINYEELMFEAQEGPFDTNYSHNAIKIEVEGLSKLQSKRYLITFAYILEQLVTAKNDPQKYGTDENIIIEPIASEVSQAIVNYKGTSNDYDSKIVANRLKVAMAMKKIFGKIKP